MIQLPIYFISDNHFMMTTSYEENKRRVKLISLFKDIKKNKGTLIIGGDFFDFWFEYPNVIPKFYVDIIAELKKLNNAGISIHYVLGNHDYWDFGSFNKLFGATVHKDDFNFNLDGQRIKVTHGDGILKNDYTYRFMRKLIRSKIFISLFSLIHPDLGCWIAKKISKTSKKMNNNPIDNNLKLELINTMVEKYPDFDKIFIGHYHQTGIGKISNQEFIFMGDWITKFTVSIINNNGSIQHSWNN